MPKYRVGMQWPVGGMPGERETFEAVITARTAPEAERLLLRDMGRNRPHWDGRWGWLPTHRLTAAEEEAEAVAALEPGVTEQIPGVLEIDHARGVLYFHAAPEAALGLAGTTVLRICRLPRPIPQGRALDVTHMVGVDYVPAEPKKPAS